ncbi:MAG: hypothetical protein M3Z04_04475 [Chloroflexota bacterium]|nr:hypothetical protein [Chloroflexota bacterium]
MAARARRVSGLLGVALGLALLPRLGLFAGFAGANLAWPWQFDYDEGVNLHAAWALAHGTNIYLANPPDRFLSAPYPPLLYVLTAPLLWLGGLGLAGPRALVLLATLAVAALLAYLTRREGLPWPGALACGALWLALSPVIIWATLYKQDMLALACGLGGLAVLGAGDRLPTARQESLALTLFALAFFTKQSALAPAAAGVAWLVLRDWRAGLRLGATLLVLLLGGFILLLVLSARGFWDHAIVYQTYPWLTEFWRRLMGRLAGEYWPLLLIGALVAGPLLGGWLGRLRRAARARAWQQLDLPLVVVYLGAATGSVMIQAGYSGANYNHLLDLFPPLIWLVGRGLAGLTAPVRWAQGVAVGVAGLALAQAAWLWQPQPLGLAGWYSTSYWPSAARDGEMQGRQQLVQAAVGDIYSEDVTLLLLNGRQPVYDDPDTIATMGDRSGWDERQLVQDLRDRRFPLILLRHGAWRWSQAAGVAFEAGYDLTFDGTLNVYRPKIYPDAPARQLDCDLGQPVELRLLGASLSPGAGQAGVPAGSDLQIALDWLVLRAPGDYATFVHLLDSSGKQVAGRDNPHSATGQPTSAWPFSVPTRELTDLPLPAGLAPGLYRLIGGVYGTAGGGFQAVPVACPDAARQVGDAVDLGAVRVR